MLVVVGLVTGCLSADVARERPRTAVHLHVLGQVVAPMEGLTALGDLAHILLGNLVFPHVPLAVVFPDELAATIVACVRLYGLVRVHVRNVLGMADKGALAERALVRFGGAAHVCPAVQLQIPLGGKRLVADDAHVRPLAAVRQHVGAQVRSQVQLEPRKHIKL